MKIFTSVANTYKKVNAFISEIFSANNYTGLFEGNGLNVYDSNSTDHLNRC